MSSANQINESMNEKLFDRNFPDKPIAPIFSPRPVSTRRQKMGIINQYESPMPQLHQNYKVSNNMYTGTSKPPFQAYASHIDTESVLRGQVYALQRSDLASYIPSSASDLYKGMNPKPKHTPHKELLPQHNSKELLPQIEKGNALPKQNIQPIMFNFNTRLEK